MEEWKLTKIGSICKKVCSGGTPKSTVKEYYGGGIPWLNTKEVHFNRIYSTESTITDKGLNNCAAKWIEANAVIIAMYGATAAKCAIGMIPMTTNQACCNLMIDKKKADYRFVYYAIANSYSILASLANGGAQQNLNAQVIKDFEILLPSLVVQKRVADVLSTLDDKIECNRRINDNLEQQAQALYKSWFIDFEPFKGDKFEDSELGMIPHGWSVKQLGEITSQVSERVKERVDVKVLSPITTGELVLSEDYFTKQVFSESISKYIVVKPTEFAYNPARVNIGSLGMNEYGYDGCVSPVYVVFRCEDEYQYFFDLFRRTETFKEEVKARAIGGVRQSLTYKDFSLIKVVYPPFDVIHNFNQIYLRILAKTKHNDVETTRLASIRDTLLPKLMSGELKIS